MSATSKEKKRKEKDRRKGKEIIDISIRQQNLRIILQSGTLKTM